MKRLLTLSALLIFSLTNIKSQISEGGLPYLLQNPNFSISLTTKTLPNVNIEALLAEDEKNENHTKFGEAISVNYTLNNSGTWHTLENGDRIWTLQITGSNALSLNINYSNFFMPPNAAFYVYSPDGKQVLGAFTERNNKSYGKFSTSLIKSESVILEYYEPAFFKNQGIIDIESVVFGYKDFNEVYKSGDCNVDVACTQADPWSDQVRSVVAILTSANTNVGSGVLINNTGEDCLPYVIAAKHSGFDTPGASTANIFIFNYENSTCRTPGSAASGAMGDGTIAQSISGGTIRASSAESGFAASSDFALIELSAQPPGSYNVYFAGWDRQNVAPTSSFIIHHPNLEEKRITIDNDPMESTDFGLTTPVANQTHWYSANYEEGTTESGSDGAPLFNQDGLVVGVFSSGALNCSNAGPGWFGKMWYSWNQVSDNDGDGDLTNNQLMTWLDPLGAGVTSLTGKNPCVCDTPTNLAGTGTSTTGIDISWDTAAGATSYEIRWRENNTIPWTGNGTSTSTSFSIMGLNICTDYDIEVRSICSGTPGSWTSTIVLATAGGASSSPNLVAPGDQTTQVSTNPTFIWTAISTANTYDLEYATSPTFTSPTSVSGISGTSTTVSGLAAGVNYYWRVRANTSCGTGNWSVPFQFSTDSGAGSGCNDAILNGDFESGNNGDWTDLNATIQQEIIAGLPPVNSGTWMANLTGNAGQTVSISQTVTIPASASSATLSYYYYNFSSIFNLFVSAGTVTVNGDLLAVYLLNGLFTSSAYTQETFDLSAYLGQTVEIKFEVTIDANESFSPSLLIEDVVVDVCLPAVSACPPSLNYINGVDDYISGDVFDNETNGNITATNIINVGADITYDCGAGNSVTLNSGFEALAGSLFNAFPDGCTGLRNWEENPNTGGNTQNETFANKKVTNTQNILPTTLQVYPNPTEGKFNILLQNINAPITLQLLDLSGKLIKEEYISYNSETAQLTWDISNLSGGVYLLKMTNQLGNTQFKKVIVNR